MDTNFAAIVTVLGRYFDGLYYSDTALLRSVFHAKAHYVCATDGTLVHLSMEEYFAVVDERPSPARRNEVRADRIVAIEFAGPVTAFARVECAIGAKFFSDLLTFVFIDDRWQIISKVFHFDLREQR